MANLFEDRVASSPLGLALCISLLSVSHPSYLPSGALAPLSHSDAQGSGGRTPSRGGVGPSRTGFIRVWPVVTAYQLAGHFLKEENLEM